MGWGLWRSFGRREEIGVTAPSASAPTIEAAQGAKKAVVGGVVGNFVEWFEYGVYGYLATVIATLFFPPGDRVAALLGTYAVFALSFLIRPLGGVIFGRFGDKIGRRNVLAVAILLMSGATACIGLLPTYATVGFLAPALLLTFRLLQGLAAGGEYVGAVAFVVEYGPENRRAYYASWVTVSVFGGLLCGVGLVTLMTTVLGDAAMEAWAWRVPFLSALVLGFVGLYLRLKIEETPAFRALQEENERALEARRLDDLEESEQHIAASPLKEALATQWKPMLIFIGFAMTNATGSYLFAAYLSTYLQEQVGLSAGDALLANSIALIVLIPLLPLSGLLCDRIGRKPMLLAGCGLFVVLSIPAYRVAEMGGLVSATAASLLLVAPILFISAGLTVSIAEMWPTRLRYSGSAIAYNVGFGLFGGGAPLIATFLVARTGDPLAVGYYVMALSTISFLVVLFFFKETYKASLARSVYDD